MDRFVRFFECLLPVSICNLRCPYCYIIQEGRRHMELADLQYPPEHIVKALSKKRVGGVSFISICGAGETFIQDELLPIVKGLLKEGHYINITTNGTLTNRIKALIDSCGELTKHLHISFSFHYTELLRLNLLDSFFESIDYVRQSGASFLLQLNLCDEYIPYLDEIKRISLKKTGAYPQVALTRNEKFTPMKIMTELSDDEYIRIGKTFKSPLFDFTCKNFNVKRYEFCYAGDWSGVLNLQNGWLSKCYNNNEGQNIFEDLTKPIEFSAVGNNCKHKYCVNSSHFMSLGIIPEISAPSYAQLRNRYDANWYSDEMLYFLDSKFSQKQYNIIKKYIVNHNITSFRSFLSTFKFYQKLHSLKSGKE